MGAADSNQEIKKIPLPSDGHLDFCSLDQVAMVKASIHLLVPVIFCGPKAGKRNPDLTNLTLKNPDGFKMAAKGCRKT